MVADIFIFLLILLGLVWVTGMFADIFSALPFSSPLHDSLEEIHRVGADARRRAQDLSDDFQQKISDLLSRR